MRFGLGRGSAEGRDLEAFFVEGWHFGLGLDPFWDLMGEVGRRRSRTEPFAPTRCYPMRCQSRPAPPPWSRTPQVRTPGIEERANTWIINARGGVERGNRTLTKPVLRSRFRWRFLISPYFANMSVTSSSSASSWTFVTITTHPSTADKRGCSEPRVAGLGGEAYIVQPWSQTWIRHGQTSDLL